MKRVLVILVLILVISALIFSSCTNSTPTTTSSSTSTTTSASSSTTTTSTTAVAARTIKFTYSMPKGADVGKGYDWFGPAFEQATNGRYKVEIYPGSSLIQGAATYDSIKSGAVEMAYTSTGTFPKQFPLSLIAGLPSLGFPQNSVKMYVASNDAFKELINTTPEVKNEFKDITLLQPIILGPYRLVAKKAEVKSAADFKGLKIGGSGGRMEIVTSNGGAKVQEIPPDSYLDMDKGVTDGAFLTWSQVNDYHIADIASFYLNYNFGNGSGLILMNTDFYNSMGAADQKILADTWAQAQEVSAQGSLNGNLLGIDVINKAGKSIYTPTAAEEAAWDTASGVTVNLWRSDAKKMGATDDLLDTVLAKWKTIRAKYLAIGAQ
jgi:TRAP-type C4-dicarboxylate transport system substrate-binding protein